MKYKILFVQPILTSYRIPFFQDLGKHIESLTVIADIPEKNFGVTNQEFTNFKFSRVSWNKKFSLYFTNIFSLIKNSKDCTHIIHFADFKYTTLTISVLIGLITQKKVLLHGQGGYKKSGIIKKIVYNLAVKFSDRYIAYNEYAALKLKETLMPSLRKKICFINNTLYIKPVSEINKKPNNEILYIGRLREGCDIEILAEACKITESKLIVIGDGPIELKESLKKIHHEILFHGAVYSDEEIKKLSQHCIAGVYPGDAGLSVVHYMSLGLPVIIHSSTDMHMGPEPAYIEDKYNGILFERKNKQSLVSAMKEIIENKPLRLNLAQNSLEAWNELSKKSMAESLLEIMKNLQKH
ncbi:hypothetical protein C4K68_23560 [Pokkaliibacter plantistimulans]|uniref:Glycosyl transferase family 1 domain-containing protein n=1 Tax=Proteobacteria bacterium 228 TaxID=2083153 RepID=A0A2S5KJN2_9PROT|nr:glycosyltransferase family 4 protein [Pokkaliibacter plantistimulans]PPC74952.1 hypothetical protein C4K68_23560 [Pokkaliibacter plantistimulans]